MIYSLYQIDLIADNATRRLLSIGDRMESEVEIGPNRDVARYSILGRSWGLTSADSSPTFVAISWSRREDHASHAAARNACMRIASLLSTQSTGTLRITIQDGETWDIEDASLVSSPPLPLVSGGFRTITRFQALGGRMVPASPIALYAGVPWDHILQNWEDLTENWETY